MWKSIHSCAMLLPVRNRMVGDLRVMSKMCIATSAKHLDESWIIAHEAQNSYTNNIGNHDFNRLFIKLSIGTRRGF
jgi:hypothetical protein